MLNPAETLKIRMYAGFLQFTLEVSRSTHTVTVYKQHRFEEIRCWDQESVLPRLIEHLRGMIVKKTYLNEYWDNQRKMSKTKVRQLSRDLGIEPKRKEIVIPEDGSIC